jgi:hypothetical protein
MSSGCSLTLPPARVGCAAGEEGAAGLLAPLLLRLLFLLPLLDLERVFDTKKLLNGLKKMSPRRKTNFKN